MKPDNFFSAIKAMQVPLGVDPNGIFEWLWPRVVMEVKEERQRIADFIRQQGLESGNKTLDPEITARMIEGME